MSIVVGRQTLATNFTNITKAKRVGARCGRRRGAGVAAPQPAEQQRKGKRKSL
jgi:hypothetical protein